jgi:hypothetical protein
LAVTNSRRINVGSRVFRVKISSVELPSQNNPGSNVLFRADMKRIYDVVVASLLAKSANEIEIIPLDDLQLVTSIFYSEKFRRSRAK